jgi:hypothetical protein
MNWGWKPVTASKMKGEQSRTSFQKGAKSLRRPPSSRLPEEGGGQKGEREEPGLGTLRLGLPPSPPLMAQLLIAWLAAASLLTRKRTAFGVSRLLGWILGGLLLLALLWFLPLMGGCRPRSACSPGLVAPATVVGRLGNGRPVLVSGVHGLALSEKRFVAVGELRSRMAFAGTSRGALASSWRMN